MEVNIIRSHACVKITTNPHLDNYKSQHIPLSVKRQEFK